ncbi:peptidylprolyl isomerase [Helicobacter sp. MIT 14-3879]|uniref:FKBP-type peptidyl-prolyl cis-trans isomerase n=1 Tax=Helicobacter sp. MIT 14-3879 TaxID=2040649 RepID=UPI000E1F1B3F|nr:peptidylprolyl isomerase [Helicobacter sp. MIT 14-3879]RDU63174.1 peptidylprolyl isomerase [Helicobacter sp. MIT 14-3879]
MIVENNHLVSICYIVTNKDDGNILDKNDNKDKPFSFIMGKNQVISGLENALLGKKIGSNFKIEIHPKDAYGEKNKDFIQEVSKEQFSGIELVKGMTLYGQSEDGSTAQVIVEEIGENSVIIDYNHPLAGKVLIFEVEILASKFPTEEEILEFSHSCGCSHNSHSGCCGGANHTNSSCGCH